MAHKGYWKQQVLHGLPEAIAEWVVISKRDEIYNTIEKFGYEDMLKYTKGSRQIKDVGRWVYDRCELVNFILDVVQSNSRHEQKNADFANWLMQELMDRFQYDWDKFIVHSICNMLGEELKDSRWWKTHKKEINQFASQLQTTKSVIES
jgi:hypothetical protein